MDTNHTKQIKHNNIIFSLDFFLRPIEVLNLIYLYVIPTSLMYVEKFIRV